MKKYLETERAYLREFTSADADILFDLNSDPEVMKYITNGVTSTREEIANVIQIMLNYYAKFPNRFGVWAAHLKSNDEFIGFYILRPDKQDPDNQKYIELGYRLRRKFWGQGYGTELSQPLVDRCFQNYDVEEVFAQAHPENQASTGVMKKVGLKFKGLFEMPAESQFHPGEKVVHYNLMRADYKKK